MAFGFGRSFKKKAKKLEKSVKKTVAKIADDVLNIDPPKAASQDEVPQDGAANTAEEAKLEKEDDKKKKRRRRTSKGKLKVPMVATQKTTGVKA